MLLAQHKGVKAEAARAIGISRGGFVESIKEAKRRKLTAESKVMSEADKWKTKAKMLEQQIAAINRENLEAQEIRQTIFNLSSETPDPPSWLLKFKPAKSSGVPMMMWSDWHYGERVLRSNVGGANAFNREIAKERIKRLVHTSIDLAKNHMTFPKYPGAVICLGGDMITGDIHDDLRETNDGSVVQALVEVEEMLIWGLAECARAFGKLLVPCVVGNHGRGTLKPRTGNNVVQSHEWGVYTRLNRHFARDKRIQFMIPEENDAYFSVCGHRYFLHHGDRLGVKGGDGIIGVLGPIARGTIKAGRQQAQMGRDFDTLIGGHYHTRLPHSDGVNAIFNGSLIGPSPYSHMLLRAPPTRPSQNLWFHHPRYGITAQWAVYLEEKQNSMKHAPWVQWQDRIAA